MAKLSHPKPIYFCSETQEKTTFYIVINKRFTNQISFITLAASELKKDCCRQNANCRRVTFFELRHVIRKWSSVNGKYVRIILIQPNLFNHINWKSCWSQIDQECKHWVVNLNWIPREQGMSQVGDFMLSLNVLCWFLSR